MRDNTRFNPRKLPVVLQIRHMADRKRASEKVASWVLGWSGRQLAVLAAVPVVSLALFIGWQLTGEPTEDALLHLSPSAVDRETFAGEATETAANGVSVETAAFDAGASHWEGPQLTSDPSAPHRYSRQIPEAGEPVETTNARPGTQRIQIRSVVSMPPAPVQQAEHQGAMMR